MTKTRFRWPQRAAAAAAAAALAGCSIHPIPDDVSRYSTDEIVRHVRCEAKEAVREEIRKALEKYDIHGIEPDKVMETRNFGRIRRRSAKLAAKFLGYSASSISYDFDFQITEVNDKSGVLSLAMPFVSSTGLAVDLSGGLAKTRNAVRKFKTVESFRELDKLDCNDQQLAAGRWRTSKPVVAATKLPPPDPNFFYPMTGSIGVSRIMHTFVKISELGGGAGDFSDTITFTTEVRGDVNPTLVLAPVTDHLKLVKATAEFKNKRTDMHKVIISLSFPKIPPLQGGRLTVGRAIIPEASRSTERRALISSCVANAEAREDQFGTLRLIPPQVYCRNDASTLMLDASPVPRIDPR